MACAQNPRTYYGARYRRIASRRGPQRPTSRSSTPCSSRSGTWAPPAPSTTTPAPTTSPGSIHAGRKQGDPPTRRHGLPRHPRPGRMNRLPVL
jgi:hypothetical protein